jgi:pimeloyl-ACP methyl ester carboxylesterase
LYHDFPKDIQETAISQLHKHIAVGAFRTPATYEPWHDIPTVYIFAEKDKCLPLELQKEGLAALIGNYTPFLVNSGHSAMLSKPERVVEGIELAVKEGLERARSVNQL